MQPELHVPGPRRPQRALRAVHLRASHRTGAHVKPLLCCQTRMRRKHRVTPHVGNATFLLFRF